MRTLVLLCAVGSLCIANSALADADDQALALPFVRAKRFGISLGARALCYDVKAMDRCNAIGQIAFVFPYGDIHVGISGTRGTIGDDMAFENTGPHSYGPIAGLEIGSRYYYVGVWPLRVPLAIGLAFRVEADFLYLITINDPVRQFSYPDYFVFSNTYGLNTEVLVSRRVALTTRFGIGLAYRYGIPFDYYGAFPSLNAPVWSFAFDAQLAVRVRL